MLGNEGGSHESIAKPLHTHMAERIEKRGFGGGEGGGERRGRMRGDKK